MFFSRFVHKATKIYGQQIIRFYGSGGRGVERSGGRKGGGEGEGGGEGGGRRKEEKEEGGGGEGERRKGEPRGSKDCSIIGMQVRGFMVEEISPFYFCYCQTV